MHKVVAIASLALFSVTAFAQAPAKAPEPAKPGEAGKPADAAKPPEMTPAKPSEEIKALAKELVGTSRCQGTFTIGGNTMKLKYQATFTTDLDGFFIAGKFAEGSKTMGRTMIWFNPETKMFNQTEFDASGVVMTSTSKGFEGGVMTWTGKGKMMGKESDSTFTITKKGPKEVQLHAEMRSGDQTATTDQVCK